MNDWRTTIIELLAAAEEDDRERDRIALAQKTDDARQTVAVYLDRTGAALDVDIAVGFFADGDQGYLGAPVEMRNHSARVTITDDLRIEVARDAAGRFGVRALYGLCPICSAWVILRELKIPGDFAAGVRRLDDKYTPLPLHPVPDDDTGRITCDRMSQDCRPAPPPPVVVLESMIYTDSNRNAAGNAITELESQGYTVDVRYGPASSNTSAKVLLIARHPGDGDPFEPF